MVVRPIAISAIAFILPVFMTDAEAQRPVVAPAPHFPAPAPYMAPRFAVPNVSAPMAPIPHLAAPNIAAPQFAAPHTSAPHDDHWATPGTIGIVGHDPDGNRRNPAQSAPTEAPNINPALILRNPAFSGLSSRNPAIRSFSRSTFGGNFAQSDFARAWDRPGQHRHFGFVLGFVGPLFWPYAFEDLSDYTFSPYAYDAFWPYAFDDVFAGIYSGYAPGYHPSEVAALTGDNSRICSGRAQGLTDFPIERIAKQIDPVQYQRTLLDDLKAATAKAIGILQAACPSELPSTPTGRIAAMRPGSRLCYRPYRLPGLRSTNSTSLSVMNRRSGSTSSIRTSKRRVNGRPRSPCVGVQSGIRAAARSNRTYSAVERQSGCGADGSQRSVREGG